VDGEQPSRATRANIVVDAISEVGDLLWGDSDRIDHSREETRPRVPHAPALGRPQNLDYSTEKVFRLLGRVPTAQTCRPNPRRASM
jgi:hypothetical protein